MCISYSFIYLWDWGLNAERNFKFFLKYQILPNFLGTQLKKRSFWFFCGGFLFSDIFEKYKYAEKHQKNFLSLSGYEKKSFSVLKNFLFVLRALLSVLSLFSLHLFIWKMKISKFYFYQENLLRALITHYYYYS